MNVQSETPGPPVRCRRTGQEYDSREHRRCPYCFGGDKDVVSGDHARFCDFKPGTDPVNFGFPPDASRQQHG